MELDDLKVYKKAMDLGDQVWGLVEDWDYFQKDTVGKQLVRSVDSIAANISEGYGRFHYKEAQHFGYYSRGSLFETKTWIQKAYNRKLIPEKKFLEMDKELTTIGKMLNGYIKSIGRVDEPNENYGSMSNEPND